MYFKHTFFTCVVLIQLVEVKCECDGYLTCIGDFIRDFFSNVENNSTKFNISNESSYNITDVDDTKDIPISYFEITDIEKSLKKVLSDVTSILKDEIESKFRIEAESESNKTLENKTEIFVKTIDLDELPESNSRDKSNPTSNLEAKVQTLNLDRFLESFVHHKGDIEDLVTNIPKTGNVNINVTTVVPFNMKTLTPMNIIKTIPTNATTITPFDTVLTTIPSNINQSTNHNNMKVQGYDKYDKENVRENEISKIDDELEIYYNNDDDDDNSTDYPIIDYIELYKDTTNEDVDYKLTEIPTSTTTIKFDDEIKSDLDNIIEYSLLKEDTLRNGNLENNAAFYSKRRCMNETADSADVVFPWIATIFRKNGTNNQFDYTCDGALLSEHVILTAARCVINSNATTDADDFIIVLGKKSLQTTGEYESVHKIKQITIHENFTQYGVKAENDLAILVLEEETALNDGVVPACIDRESGEIEEAATTGWGAAGKLISILFDANTSEHCKKNTPAENIFCAKYGNDVTLCPSYGGLYVSKHNSSWSLQGIRTGDTRDRGFCLDRTVVFTSLNNYSEWIAYHIDLNKVL